MSSNGGSRGVDVRNVYPWIIVIGLVLMGAGVAGCAVGWSSVGWWVFAGGLLVCVLGISGGLSAVQFEPPDSW